MKWIPFLIKENSVKWILEQNFEEIWDPDGVHEMSPTEQAWGDKKRAYLCP